MATVPFSEIGVFPPWVCLCLCRHALRRTIEYRGIAYLFVLGADVDAADEGTDVLDGPVRDGLALGIGAGAAVAAAEGRALGRRPRVQRRDGVLQVVQRVLQVFLRARAPIFRTDFREFLSPESVEKRKREEVVVESVLSDLLLHFLRDRRG